MGQSWVYFIGLLLAEIFVLDKDKTFAFNNLMFLIFEIELIGGRTFLKLPHKTSQLWTLIIGR